MNVVGISITTEEALCLVGRIAMLAVVVVGHLRLYRRASRTSFVALALIEAAAVAVVLVVPHPVAAFVASLPTGAMIGVVTGLGFASRLRWMRSLLLFPPLAVGAALALGVGPLSLLPPNRILFPSYERCLDSLASASDAHRQKPLGAVSYALVLDDGRPYLFAKLYSTSITYHGLLCGPVPLDLTQQQLKGEVPLDLSLRDVPRRLDARGADPHFHESDLETRTASLGYVEVREPGYYEIVGFAWDH